MKKIISVILSLILVFSTCAVAFSASVELDKDEISEYPLIIVPGYSSSSLVYPAENEVVWGVNMDAVLDRVLSDIVEIGVGLGALTVGNAKIIAKPEITATVADASLIHEAAIGKIAGEQLIKLMTLGLTEKEAEEAIINGFLK